MAMRIKEHFEHEKGNLGSNKLHKLQVTSKREHLARNGRREEKKDGTKDLDEELG